MALGMFKRSPFTPDFTYLRGTITRKPSVFARGEGFKVMSKVRLKGEVLRPRVHAWVFSLEWCLDFSI